MTSDSWRGKVAIVTGGSSGIGAATALALVERGACVAITGRNQARLKRVAANSDAILALELDSAQPSSAASVVGAALGKWGRLDLLVNNAGAGKPLPIDAYTDEAITEIGAVNIVGPSLLVKHASGALRETRGAIVSVSSAVSRSAAPMLAHYAASKAALEHLTTSWAMELAESGVRVNGVAPGPVKSGALTGMMGLKQDDARMIEEREALQVPLGRRGITSDIVPWILRLGDSSNAWLTGQTITVDGGWSLRS
ncbi:MAG: SDR family oxidoreductase [Polyangiaceae bacterium]|nr:SDR family oxidoreductase [Polyangiaceae bacterium]MCB9610583.1 SDR family oxidoreductase [Polyangiaceae bacterium]